LRDDSFREPSDLSGFATFRASFALYLHKKSPYSMTIRFNHGHESFIVTAQLEGLT